MNGRISCTASPAAVVQHAGPTCALLPNGICAGRPGTHLEQAPRAVAPLVVAARAGLLEPTA